MCNCKGWDVIYYPELIDLTPHFCRIADDCGHVDNSLEEAVNDVVLAYQQLHDSYVSFTSTGVTEYDPAQANHYLFEKSRWEKRTHPSYIYYNEGKDAAEKKYITSKSCGEDNTILLHQNYEKLVGKL